MFDDGGVTRLTCAPNPLVEQITLSWTDTAGASHNVVYSVTGDDLQRDYDINPTPLVMAIRVVANSISFTPCWNTLRLNVDVLGDRNTTDSLDLITYVRKFS